MFKKFIILFLCLASLLYAEYDKRLDSYSNGRALYEKASVGDEDAQFDLGLLYDEKIKDYDLAVVWYEKAYKQGSIDAAFNMGVMFKNLQQYDNAIHWYTQAVLKGDSEASLNLGLLYKKLQRYDDAIFYYKKAYALKDTGAANALGYLYEHDLKKIKIAENWYIKAVQENNKKAIGNLAKLYHNKNENIKAGAYALALIDNGFSKKDIFEYLHGWKLTDEEIKQAYQLQKTLDIPKHYYDPELESELTKQRLDKHEKKDLR